MRAKLSSFLIIMTSAALALSACTNTDTASSSAESSAAPSTSTDANASTKQTEPKIALQNPREITGVSQVGALPDPKPIEGKYKQKLPATITDFDGKEITVTDTSRILALDITGTLSRTVISLGYGDKLVGRTVSSTETQLADLPVVTENGHSLNAEAIMQLNPTLVFADGTVGPPEVLDQLRSAGIPVVSVNSKHNIDNVSESIDIVAQALGVEEAGKALDKRAMKEIEEAKAKIATWAPDDPLKVSFLYVRGTGGVFFILGPDEGSSALIEAVGAKDMAKENNIKGIQPANAESLVSLNPEVFFVMKDGLESTGGETGFLARPGVSDTVAGQKPRIIAIPDGISLAFGPQTGDIILEVAKALYGVKE